MMEKKASALKPPEMTRRGFVKASAVAAAGIAGAGCRFKLCAGIERIGTICSAGGCVVSYDLFAELHRSVRYKGIRS